MQSKASEICALLGGKMPHVLSLDHVVTSFVATEDKIDDFWCLVREVRDLLKAPMIPET